MSLYEGWLKQAYNKDGKSIKSLWDEYIPLEQGIYEDILENKLSSINTTVKELSEKYNMSNEFICGFIDGINDAIDEPISIENLTSDDEITLNINFETLYKKMVEYKADHLYTLPQWNNVFDDYKRKALFEEQKKSGTFVRGQEKIGRNDLCPCNSGKKYKKCCGL